MDENGYLEIPNPGYVSAWDVDNLPETAISGQWMYIDLGDRYHLDQLQIWNYLEIYYQLDLRGRSAKDISIYVGDEGAELPKENTVVEHIGTDGFPDAFEGKTGWAPVYTGVLRKGPSTLQLQAGQKFRFTDQVPLKQMIGRYIGIDFDSNYRDYPAEDAHGNLKFLGLTHLRITGEKVFRGTRIILK